MDITRRGALRYDWTPWDKEQLALMEVQWDEWAKFYRQFLDSGMRHGINLGTHNGAIQKAFQRLGFWMYGVEATDHISELIEYGCNGERANFFDMPNIRTNQYDFAVLDRALCSNKSSYDLGKNPPVHLGTPPRYTDLGLSKPDYSPSIFDDPVRVVKPGGLLIVSFRTYVTRPWFEDLASRGTLKIYIDNRRLPYFIAVLRVGGSSTNLPTLGSILTADFESNLVTSEYVARLKRKSTSFEFLFIPDNIFVSLSKDGRVIRKTPFWNEQSNKEAEE